MDPDVPFILGVDPGATTGLAGVCAETGGVLFVDSCGPLDTARRLEAWASSRTGTGADVLSGVYVEVEVGEASEPDKT